MGWVQPTPARLAKSVTTGPRYSGPRVPGPNIVPQWVKTGFTQANAPISGQSRGTDSIDSRHGDCNSRDTLQKGALGMAVGPEHEMRGRLAGPGRQVYVASALALTEPGPAAAGIVVMDDKARVLAHRSQYLGRAGRGEATARDLLAATQL